MWTKSSLQWAARKGTLLMETSDNLTSQLQIQNCYQKNLNLTSWRNFKDETNTWPDVKLLVLQAPVRKDFRLQQLAKIIIHQTHLGKGESTQHFAHIASLLGLGPPSVLYHLLFLQPARVQVTNRTRLRKADKSPFSVRTFLLSGQVLFDQFRRWAMSYGFYCPRLEDTVWWGSCSF